MVDEFDVFDAYMEQANWYASQIKPVDLAELFFEEVEGLKEAEKTEENNVKNEEGFFASIKKAIDALIKAVKNMIGKFGEWVHKLSMTAADKAQFERVKKLMEEHPELGKVEITVFNYKAYEDVITKAVKKLEAEYKSGKMTNESAEKIVAEAENEIVPPSDIMNAAKKAKSEGSGKIINWDKFVDNMSGKAGEGGKNAKRFLMKIPLKAALELGAQDRLSAKAMNFMIENELVDLEALSNEVGEKEAKKFAKKMNKYAHAGFFHKCKMKLLNLGKNTWWDIAKVRGAEMVAGEVVKNSPNIVKGVVHASGTAIDIGNAINFYGMPLV